MVHRYCLAAACATFLGAAEPAGAQNFTVRSTADGFLIHGQTDLPSKGSPRAVVVFLPGSGNHSRDFEFAAPANGQKAFVFRDLSARLTGAGFATIRHDERAVSCVGKTRPADGDDRCHDATAAQTITMDTNTGDVEAVYRHAQTGPGGRCVILLGHSEGFYHIGRLVDRRGVQPAGIIGVGAPLESLRSLTWSQWVDTLPRSLGMSDLDGNGRITKAEFMKNLPNTPIGGSSFYEISWPPGFTWLEQGLAPTDISALRNWRVDEYHKQRAEVLSKPPGELLTRTVNGRVLPRSSYAWFHPFFEDWTPTAGMLGTYEGPIHLFYGTRDVSVNPERQLAVARQLLGKAHVEATLTPGLGHTLGEHPTYGPMRLDQQEALVTSSRRIADGCAAVANRRVSP